MSDKTIKEIADELGVSKTAVMKQIANLGLRSSLRKNANQFAVDKNVEALIVKAFSEKSQTKIANQSQTESQTSLRLYDILQAELEAKNDLIKAQQKTIDRLTSTVEAYSQKELAGKLIEGQKLIGQTNGVADPQSEVTPPKKKPWQFWKE